MTADVGDGDGVAVGDEVVHFEAGETGLGELAFVRFLFVVKRQGSEVVEGGGLDGGQVELCELRVELITQFCAVL